MAVFSHGAKVPRALVVLMLGGLLVVLLVGLAALGSKQALAVPPAASTLYLVQEDFPGGNDILLKFESGVLTTVGNIGFGNVRGLAYDATSATLYGVSRQSNRLIVIDPSTGAGTVVGTASYLPPGSNTAEISVNAAGAMFGIGHLNDQGAQDTFLGVDKASGIATAIGGFGANLSGLAIDHDSGIHYGQTFFGFFYTINATVGSATSLGSITGSNGSVGRIAFDQASGLLYGITFNAQLVTIDIATRVATEVAQFSTPDQIYALDFISVAPAPVGGLVVDLDGELGDLPLEAPDSSGSNAGLFAGVVAAIAAGTITLGSAAWYTRRRWAR